MFSLQSAFLQVPQATLNKTSYGNNKNALDYFATPTSASTVEFNHHKKRAEGSLFSIGQSSYEREEQDE